MGDGALSNLYRHGHSVLGVEYWVLALGARTNFPLLSEEGGLRACADGVVPPHLIAGPFFELAHMMTTLNVGHTVLPVPFD